MAEVPQSQSGVLVLSEPCHGKNGRADIVADTRLQVHFVDQVGSDLQHLPEAAFALPRRLLCPAALRHVTGGRDDGCGPAAVVADHGRQSVNQRYWPSLHCQRYSCLVAVPSQP